MVDLNERDRLLNFIHDSDEEWTIKKAKYEALKQQKLAIISLITMKSELKTDKAKEAEAYASDAYANYLSALECAYIDYHMINTQRSTANLRLTHIQTEISYLKTGLVF